MRTRCELVFGCVVAYEPGNNGFTAFVEFLLAIRLMTLMRGSAAGRVSQRCVGNMCVGLPLT
ncbi:MAG: hypothetical protein HUU55_11780 [Myxococcales bacterium]|nr:hypothetical protein [Myxococcales bacterium]